MSQSLSTPVESNGSPQKSRRDKVAKTLPTWRLGFAKQVEVLRAYAAACSSSGSRPISNTEVSRIVGLKPDTVSFANPFFASIGLLEKSDRGHTPCPAVLALTRAFEWNSQTGLHKLAPIMQQQWFAQDLLPKLQLRQRDELEVIRDLGDIAQVGPDAKGQLITILEYLEACGLIIREDGVVKLARTIEEIGEGRPSANGSAVPCDNESQQPSSVSTVFAKATTGGVQIAFNLNVDEKEMGSWEPKRIEAFFSGIAQVLTAKAGLEKQEGSSKTAG